MQVEVIATGSELCTGQVVNTNSAVVGRRLLENGIQVTRHTMVPDHPPLLRETFRNAVQSAQVLIISGGLGPTSDDITAEALAAACDRDMVSDPKARQAVQRFYSQRGRTCPADVLDKLCRFPRGAEMIHNPVGTAPGFRLQAQACRIYVLPGVPAELVAMFEGGVLPDLLAGRLPADTFRQDQLTVFGLSEPQLNRRLVPLMEAFPHVTLGFQLRFPEILVKLQALGRWDTERAQARRAVVLKLGNALVSGDGQSLVEAVARDLTRRGQRLAVAESCTGGLIAHELTNLDGSSAFFDLGAVTYANHAKTRVLGVAADTIDDRGAVSEPVVKAMAAGVRDRARTDWGLSTSGIAGPAGGTAEKPVGTVWIGLASREGCFARQYRFNLKDRLRHKRIFAFQALDVLRQALSELS